MHRQLLARLVKLEASMAPRRSLMYRYGYLTKLPAEYTGEKHVVITSRIVEGPGREHCEFEERRGPAPFSDDDGGLTICFERGPDDGDGCCDYDFSEPQVEAPGSQPRVDQSRDGRPSSKS